MKLDHILGKIFALTKQFYLQEAPNSSIPSKWFTTGPTFGFEWWITDSGLRICEEISNMVISFIPQLRGGDNKSFCEIIERVFEENAFNKDFFDNDAVFFRREKTLFNARSIEDKREFALRLWEKIRDSLIESMVEWVVLYPLHRIRCDSTGLGFDGIHLLEANDKNEWEKISERYSDAKYWDPSTGTRTDLQDRCFCGNPPPTWLSCEVVGTASGAMNLAGRRMRTFLAIFFSHLYHKVPGLLNRSIAQEISHSIQFPSDSSTARCGQRVAPIGRLLPPLIVDVNLSLEDISEMKVWYTVWSSAQKESMRRAATASHFIHYAIMSVGLERYLFFFIALDALFGMRDRVEKTIVNGIKRAFPEESNWEDRAEELFDLRSELVHGGCTNIERNQQVMFDFDVALRNLPFGLTNSGSGAYDLYIQAIVTRSPR